jgi:SAM-dependent methyltransferase
MSREHWQSVWSGRTAEEVSWYQPDCAVSIELLRRVSTPGAAVVDVGGGASRLVDHLLAADYDDLTVLDLSGAALSQAQERLGADASRVTWVVGDVTTYEFGRRFDVWHDRAVLHFLGGESERAAYVANLTRSLADGGHVIVSAFGPAGPEQCSGLPVRRYDEGTMEQTLGPAFEPVDFAEEIHTTPSGVEQQFLYGLFRRSEPAPS